MPRISWSTRRIEPAIYLGRELIRRRGSLVSGRGNFRPGFYGRDAGSFMSEPSFDFSKRSTHQYGQWPYNR
uniref:Uncharacterized protein n=1 Tax=Ditylenchus dipsaci TaxID=166011 RepID=A0A915DAS5_9BILA